MWTWARGAPQNFGFPFNISATAEASDFKFGIQLGFAMFIINSHPEKKWAWPWARGAPLNWEFHFNIYAMAESIDFKFGTQFGCPIRPIIKNTFRGKSGRGLGQGSSSKFEFPFNISATIKDNDVQIGRQVGFANARNRIVPKEKVGVAMG